MPNDQRSATIQLAIDAAGTTFWNGEAIDRPGAQARLAEAARQTPQPELHIRPSKRAKYDVVARVLASAQRNGMRKIGFVGNEQFM